LFAVQCAERLASSFEEPYPLFKNKVASLFMVVSLPEKTVEVWTGIAVSDQT
jgi:hypothetical protein